MAVQVLIWLYLPILKFIVGRIYRQFKIKFSKRDGRKMLEHFFVKISRNTRSDLRKVLQKFWGQVGVTSEKVLKNFTATLKKFWERIETVRKILVTFEQILQTVILNIYFVIGSTYIRFRGIYSSGSYLDFEDPGAQ